MMNEVYWLAGMIAPNQADDPAPLSKWIAETLQKSGIKPQWVNEINLISSQPDLDQIAVLPTDMNQIPLLRWKISTPLNHKIVQFACQSILSGDLDMILFAEFYDQHWSILILGSPKTIGKYNLPPQARFLKFWTSNSPSDFLFEDPPAIFPISITETEQIGAEDIDYISGCDPREQAVTRQFPHAKMPESVLQTQSVLSQINQFVQHSKKSKIKYGLVVSMGEPGFITLMESI
ncbi:MAG: hypothetical protein ABFD29_07050 [Anaerolineaceae bacterium]